MTRSPLSSFYEDIDQAYDATSVISAVVVSGIVFAIIANLNSSSETKPAAQEREKNYGMDEEEAASCRAASSELVNPNEELTNSAVTEA
jgi:hypothetical protein